MTPQSLLESHPHWPDRPTCHDDDWQALRWARGPEGRIWKQHGALRCCDYCGSLHPEDLMQVLARGARLGGADWKYGWPHKFYIHGGPPDAIKWYNKHLRDLDPGVFAPFAAILDSYTNILFELIEDGKLYYRAPYHGYQIGY